MDAYIVEGYSESLLRRVAVGIYRIISGLLGHEFSTMFLEEFKLR